MRKMDLRNISLVELEEGWPHHAEPEEEYDYAGALLYVIGLLAVYALAIVTLIISIIHRSQTEAEVIDYLRDLDDIREASRKKQNSLYKFQLPSTSKVKLKDQDNGNPKISPKGNSIQILIEEDDSLPACNSDSNGFEERSCESDYSVDSQDVHLTKDLLTVPHPNDRIWFEMQDLET